MRTRPSLDLHAHVDTAIAPGELTPLGVVFAATRSLAEADVATRRNDQHTVWGVGCHPRLVKAQRDFESDRFAALIQRTAFVSEIGLDGTSGVPIATQEATLDRVFALLAQNPRLASLHSYRASGEVLRSLERTPIEGCILHWWLGDEDQTHRALDLGCYFSVNASSIRHSDLLGLIPLDRLLTETDHPFGDRRCGRRARPGFVEPVEEALARLHGISTEALRGTIWANLAKLVGQCGCAQLLPRPVRRLLLAS